MSIKDRLLKRLEQDEKAIEVRRIAPIISRMAARIRELRESRGDISQRALADRVGTSQARISELEGGQNFNPTFLTLSRVAHALDVDVWELLCPVGVGLHPPVHVVVNDPPRFEQAGSAVALPAGAGAPGQKFYMSDVSEPELKVAS